MRSGKGKLIQIGGAVFDGEWIDGKMNGFGTLMYENGKIAYEGYWRDDKFEGNGIIYNENPYPSTALYDYKNFTDIGNLWIKYEGGFIDD